MDVCGVFVGDASLAYGRSSYYRDYEQFPYGTLENQSNYLQKDSYSRVQEKCQQVKVVKITKKECPFCKEHKKRPLTKYLRTRKHNESICEEEEEEEVEEEENQDQTEEHNYHDQNKK